jgi:PhnB protein
MGQLITYFAFNGNCKEAMKFYQQCLGGELHFQTLGESPVTEKLSENMKAYIVRASLKKDNMVLMGTDMVDEQLIPGNSVSVLLECNNEDQIRTYYQNLRVGGKATHPIQKSHWGDLFGGLTDKYGNHWLFHCKESHISKSNKNGKNKIRDSR